MSDSHFWSLASARSSNAIPQSSAPGPVLREDSGGLAAGAHAASSRLQPGPRTRPFFRTMRFEIQAGLEKAGGASTGTGSMYYGRIHPAWPKSNVLFPTPRFMLLFDDREKNVFPSATRGSSSLNRGAGKSTLDFGQAGCSKQSFRSVKICQQSHSRLECAFRRGPVVHPVPGRDLRGARIMKDVGPESTF